MASIDPSITVAVESVIHGTLTKVIQHIEDEHGIRVQDLQVAWQIEQSMGAPTHATIFRLRVSTSSGK